MVFAQFYETKLDGSLGEVCGNDGIAVLDGRWSIQHCVDFIRGRVRRQCELAAKEPRKYVDFSRLEGFRIFKGESFTKNRSVTGYISLK